jgi:transcription antitermination protein NusB
MISRRIIRIKVMQALYSFAAMENESGSEIRIPKKLVDEILDNALDLYTVAVLYPIRVAEYAVKDAINRNSKYLTTDDDRHVSTKIANNLFVKKLNENASLEKRIKDRHLNRFVNEDWLKKIFGKLLQSPQYAAYIKVQEFNIHADKEMIRFIWEHLILESEDVMTLFKDELPGWEDDKEMVVLLMENVYKGSSALDFMDLLSSEKRLYANDLFATVLDKEQVCLELIESKLANWDKQRVALIDMILLKMGVCEFLYFPTIPTKVTINEYIEIAKQYSTPQSGQFVNGVLDNILKELLAENKVKKQERIRK